MVRDDLNLKAKANFCLKFACSPVRFFHVLCMFGSVGDRNGPYCPCECEWMVCMSCNGLVSCPGGIPCLQFPCACFLKLIVNIGCNALNFVWCILIALNKITSCPLSLHLNSKCAAHFYNNGTWSTWHGRAIISIFLKYCNYFLSSWHGVCENKWPQICSDRSTVGECSGVSSSGVYLHGPAAADVWSCGLSRLNGMRQSCWQMYYTLK